MQLLTGKKAGCKKSKSTPVTRFFYMGWSLPLLEKNGGREPPQLWHLRKQLKIKPCWFPNNQQSVTIVTPGWKTQFLRTPFIPEEGQSYVFHAWQGRCQSLGIFWIVCFLQKRKGTVPFFLLLQQSNLSDACTIATKPAYALSLGHSSRQSYKFFKVFEQPWIKDDNNHLASDFY